MDDTSKHSQLVSTANLLSHVDSGQNCQAPSLSSEKSSLPMESLDQMLSTPLDGADNTPLLSGNQIPHPQVASSSSSQQLINVATSAATTNGPYNPVSSATNMQQLLSCGPPPNKTIVDVVTSSSQSQQTLTHLLTAPTTFTSSMSQVPHNGGNQPVMARAVTITHPSQNTQQQQPQQQAQTIELHQQALQPQPPTQLLASRSMPMNQSTAAARLQADQILLQRLQEQQQQQRQQQQQPHPQHHQQQQLHMSNTIFGKTPLSTGPGAINSHQVNVMTTPQQPGTGRIVSLPLGTQQGQQIVVQTPLNGAIGPTQQQQQTVNLPVGGSGDIVGSQASGTQLSGNMHNNIQTDPQKRRLIQQQLVLLLHAHRCQRQEAEGNGVNCTMPHCRTMRGVLMHMTACSDGKNCSVPHCASSRQIIYHWKNCTSKECPVCEPLKQQRPNLSNTGSVAGGGNPGQQQTSIPGQPRVPAGVARSGVTVAHQQQRQQGQQTSGQLPQQSQQQNVNTLQARLLGMAGGGGNQSQLSSTGNNPASNAVRRAGNVPVASSQPQNSVANSSVMPIGGTSGANTNTLDGCLNGNADAPSKSHPWHREVTSEMRQHLVRRIVMTIFPSPDPSAYKDPRMDNLIQYARRVEKDMYEQATNKEDYFHMLAEKCYKIHKELEEKRRNRQQGGSGNNSSGSGSGASHLIDGLPQSSSNVGGSSIANLLQQTANTGLSQTQSGGSGLQSLMTAQSPASGLGNGQRNGPASISNSPGYSRGGSDIGQNVAHRNGQSISHASSGLAQDAFGPIPNSNNVAMLETENQFNRAYQSFQLEQQRRQQLQADMARRVSDQNMVSQSNLSISSNAQPRQLGSTKSEVKTEPNDGTVSADSNSQSRISSGNNLASLLNGPPSQQLPSQTGGSSSTNDSGDLPIIKTEIASEGSEMPATSSTITNDYDGESSVKSETKALVPMGMPSGPTMQLKTEASSQPQLKIKSQMKLTAGSYPGPKGTIEGPKEPRCRKVWTQTELCSAFLELHRRMSDEPDAAPFLKPVDIDELNIPDYPRIIKHPMDMSTIKKKLTENKYSDPWEVVDDWWLMFNNAWLYNKRSSRVYRMTTKVAESFEREIDPIMRKLGFCCGREYVFQPQVLCCFSGQLCTINRDATYYAFYNTDKAETLLIGDKYLFCEKCYNEPGEEIELCDEPGQPIYRVKKDRFVQEKNNIKEPEPLCFCRECGRRWHKICAMWLPEIWPSGFVCPTCIKEKGIKVKENRFIAKRLLNTKLGQFLENRVNNYLKKKEACCGEVTIRVLSSSDKVCEVKERMREKFTEMGEMPESFPYRAKAIFAFQDIDGHDVCFFGLHVQEYGSNCSPPNFRRVYIAYLDSVFFFRPKQYRTDVYHEILIGYLSYVKALGYAVAHIWACPPSEGDDYIFHLHPLEQKIPKPRRLQEWYKKMLDKALIERIVMDYKNILQDACEINMTSPAEIPYFEGDFWPGSLEDTIKEVEMETKRRLEEEEAEAAAQKEDETGEEGLEICEHGEGCALESCVEKTNVDGGGTGNNGAKKGNPKGSKKRRAKSKGNPIASKRKKQSGLGREENPLAHKVYENMERHKDVFFVIRLFSKQDAAKLKPIDDPDMFVNCELMDGRDNFLSIARERHLEFSSLRRAKYSTMVLLYELHNEGQKSFMYTCNECSNQVVTRYHCNECEDYDLCVNCYKSVQHQHPMSKIALGIDEDADGGSGEARSPCSMQESRRVSIERCIRSLVHACQCRDANCRNPTCMKMKRVLCHMKNCKRKSNGACSLCKQLVALCCYHAKFCAEQKCSVPFCQNIRYRLKQQRMQQRHNQAQMLRRRMAVMQRGATGGTVPAIQISAQSAAVAPTHQQHPQTVSAMAQALQQGSQQQSVTISQVLIQNPQQVIPSHHLSGSGTQTVYTTPSLQGNPHIVRSGGNPPTAVQVGGGKPGTGAPHPQSVVRWPSPMVQQGGQPGQPGQRMITAGPGQMQIQQPSISSHRNISDILRQVTASCQTQDERKMKLEQFLRDNPQLNALLRNHQRQQQGRHVQSQPQPQTPQVTLVNMVQPNGQPGNWNQPPHIQRFRQQQQQQHPSAVTNLYPGTPAGFQQAPQQRVPPSGGGGQAGTLEQLMLAQQQQQHQNAANAGATFPSGLTAGGSGVPQATGPGGGSTVVVNSGPQCDGSAPTPATSLQPEQLANFCDKL